MLQTYATWQGNLRRIENTEKIEKFSFFRAARKTVLGQVEHETFLWFSLKRLFLCGFCAMLLAGIFSCPIKVEVTN